MNENLKHIPIVFDKSHLLTIGERLYSTSLDLVRELVSNAYDADATAVRITVQPGSIVIEDNGSGMDATRLHQYFTIGSQEKRIHSVSPKFRRKRIGEFGVGKFSVLTIAERFLIETQEERTQFRARILFDAREWNRDPQNWQVPCEVVPYDPGAGSGTRITITKMKKQLDPTQVTRAVRERLPLGREDFRISVNGNEVTATTIPGKRFPVSMDTRFGLINGEIILASLPPTQRNIADAGITIRVKQIAVTKELFGFEGSHMIGVNRLRGWINADFLPITSSRDNVVRDSSEFKEVYERVREILRGVLRDAKMLAFQREDAKASEALRDALDKIGRALKKNPLLFVDQAADAPLGYPAGGTMQQEEGYNISKAQFVEPGAGLAPKTETGGEMMEPKKQPSRRRHAILGNRAIIRKLSFHNLGIVCRMDRFGASHPPSFREQGTIMINIDHPLYRKQSETPQLLMVFMSALIAKEVALEKHPHDAAEAYTVQYRLLTDAFKDVRKL